MSENFSSGSNLIILSNRLPCSFKKIEDHFKVEKGAGGLVTALYPILENSGGIWIGWPGTVNLSEIDEIDVIKSLHNANNIGFDIVPVFINASNYEKYYEGYCNKIIWPLFHSLVSYVEYDETFFEAFLAINKQFVTISSIALEKNEKRKSHSTIMWIHDYHLMLVPNLLRITINKMYNNLKMPLIAFFLHIPFPPFDIFRTLIEAFEILIGLLGADVIGFHTIEYKNNFFIAIKNFVGSSAIIKENGIEYNKRFILVEVAGLGIPFNNFENMATSNMNLCISPLKKYACKYILGVDRLDYTKGIPQRLKAFEKLLSQNSELIEKIVLIQIAVPSRESVKEYISQKNMIEQLVSQVNGRFSTLNWQPIQFFHKNFTHLELASLYRDVDIMLVSPLRDGMNLVAKEFVACQIANPGVLILSTFAGAANSMEDAIFINPYYLEEFAEIIYNVLKMKDEDKKERMLNLRKYEEKNDTKLWAKNFMITTSSLLELNKFKPDLNNLLLDKLDLVKNARNLFLFLDYDGTIADISNSPQDARLSSKMDLIIQSLINLSINVSIVSGRSIFDLKKRISNDRIILAGNHGFEIEMPNKEKFVHPELKIYEKDLFELEEDLKLLCNDFNGSYLETKGFTCTFHFRNVDAIFHSLLTNKIVTKVQNHGFVARSAKLAIEGIPPICWDKGYAVLHILNSLFSNNWEQKYFVVYIGDDVTDESAFVKIRGKGLTIKVGDFKNTVAELNLSNVTEVEKFLEKIKSKFM